MRVQASDTETFDRILFDKEFDADEPVDINHCGLAPGEVYRAR